MEKPKKIDGIISDEDLRLRIRKIIPEQKQSSLEKLSRHPLFALFVGFLLTWGIGGLLTDKLKSDQLENERKLEQVKSKRENGILAINEITGLMYSRYAASTLLASSIKRKAPIEELKERKRIYDEAYLKWNTNIQTTQLTVRGLTSDTVYSKIEAVIQYCLMPHYNNIDINLTEGYDARMNSQNWTYDTLFLKQEFKSSLDCGYTISNYLWIRANLYGDEKYNTREVIKKAEEELKDRCQCIH